MVSRPMRPGLSPLYGSDVSACLLANSAADLDRSVKAAGGARQRLRRQAHGVRQRQQRHDHRQGGDFWAGPGRPLESINPAIEISNATMYGLAAYVNGADTAEARVVASRLRAGRVWGCIRYVGCNSR